MKRIGRGTCVIRIGSYKRKAKDDIALLQASRVWEGVVKCGCVSVRTVQVDCKIGENK